MRETYYVYNDSALILFRSLSRDLVTSDLTFGARIQAKGVSSPPYNISISSSPNHISWGVYNMITAKYTSLFYT